MIPDDARPVHPSRALLHDSPTFPPVMTAAGGRPSAPLAGRAGPRENLEGPHTLPLLRARGRTLAKTRYRTAEGDAWRLYDGARDFEVEAVEVRDLAGLAGVVRDLLGRLDTCAIRGALTAEGAREVARRRTVRRTVRAQEDGTPAHWQDAPRAWACFDIDGGDFGRDIDPADPAELRAAAELVRLMLPEAARTAGAVVAWSASAFTRDRRTAKAHAWILLAEPRTSAEVKAWAIATGAAVDRALFNPVQVHYTAAPRFLAPTVDPVAERVVVFDGPPAEIPRVEDPGVTVRVRDREAARAVLDALDWTAPPGGFSALSAKVRAEVDAALEDVRQGRARHDAIYAYGRRCASLYGRGEATPPQLRAGAEKLAEALGMGAARAAEVERTFRDGFQRGGELVEALDPVEVAEPEPDRAAPSRYITADEVEKAGPVVLLAGDYGTGKTAAVAAVAAHGSLLAVSPRVSLCQDAATRLGAACYLDLEGRIDAERVVVCGPSLGRIEPRTFDRVFIDESETVLAELFGPLYAPTRAKGRPTGFDTYCRLRREAEAAGAIIVADANAGPVTRAFLASLRPDRPDPAIITRSHPLNGRRLVIWEDRAELVDDLDAAIKEGARAFVACTCKATAKRAALRAELVRAKSREARARLAEARAAQLEAEAAELDANVRIWGAVAEAEIDAAGSEGRALSLNLRAERLRAEAARVRAQVDAPVLCLTGDTPEAARSEALRNVRAAWGDAAVVVVSPVVESGVSYDEDAPRFDRVVLIAERNGRDGEGADAAGLGQMVERVRDRSAPVDVYFDPRLRHDLPCDLEDVRAELLERWEAVVAERSGGVGAVDWTGPLVRDFFDLAVVDVAERRRLTRDVRLSFARRWRARGGAVETRAGALREAHKAHKAAKAEEADRPLTDDRPLTAASRAKLREAEAARAPGRELDREVDAEVRVERVRDLAAAAILPPGVDGRPAPDADPAALERARMVEVFGEAQVGAALKSAAAGLAPLGREPAPEGVRAALAGNLIDDDRSGAATRAAHALTDLTLALGEAEGDARAHLALTASDRAQAAGGTPGAVRPRAARARMRLAVLADLLGLEAVAALSRGEAPDLEWTGESLRAGAEAAVARLERTRESESVHTSSILFPDPAPRGVDGASPEPAAPPLKAEAHRLAAQLREDPVKALGTALRALGLKTTSTRPEGGDRARIYRIDARSAAVARDRAAELIRRALAAVTAPEPRAVHAGRVNIAGEGGPLALWARPGFTTPTPGGILTPPATGRARRGIYETVVSTTKGGALPPIATLSGS